MFHIHTTIGEHRLLRKMATPEAPAHGAEGDAAHPPEAGAEHPPEGGEKPAKKKGGVEGGQADTHDKVHKVAGKEIDHEPHLDLRPKPAEPKKPVTRHLKNAWDAVPSVGEGVKGTLTFFGAAFPPLGLLGIAAGVTGKKIWNKIRGNKEKVTYPDAVKEGVRSFGKILATPFRVGANVAKFGVEATGRTLNTVVGGPLRAVNRLFVHEGKGEKKHLIKEALRGMIRYTGEVLYLPIHLVRSIPHILKHVVDDLDKHPIATGLGLGFITVAITNPAAAALIITKIVDVAANFLNLIPEGLKWLIPG